MSTRTILREARRRAGMSQRQLAGAAGLPQPTVARIESGAVSPRSETVDRLLRVLGSELALVPRIGTGIDRTLIRDRLAMTPAQRAARAVEEARAVMSLGRVT